MRLNLLTSQHPPESPLIRDKGNIVYFLYWYLELWLSYLVMTSSIWIWRQVIMPATFWTTLTGALYASTVTSHHHQNFQMTTPSPWDFPPSRCIYWWRSITVASPQPGSLSPLSVTAVTAISLYNPSTCARRRCCLVVVNSIKNWSVRIMVCLWVLLFRFNAYDLYFPQRMSLLFPIHSK